MTNDAVDGSVGEDARGVAVGKGISQQSNRAGDIHLSGGENAMWYKLLEMQNDIRDLAYKLDRILERVGKLERVEVVVTPTEVVVRPRTQEVKGLTDRMLLIVLIVMLIAVLAVVTLFVVWVVRNA